MLSAGIKISADNKTILEETKAEQPAKKKSFSEVYKDVTSTINKLKERIVAGDNDLAESMTSIIEQYLGAGKKITEATPAQQDLVEAALAELKEL